MILMMMHESLQCIFFNGSIMVMTLLVPHHNDWKTRPILHNSLHDYIVTKSNLTDGGNEMITKSTKG
jgi:hypothetical protein